MIITHKDNGYFTKDNMTASSILRLVGRRANNLVASHQTIRSLSATAPAAVASTSSTNSETDIRGVAAVMAAATGAGFMMSSWRSDNKRTADCTAITAVVGKDGFGARCVLVTRRGPRDSYSLISIHSLFAWFRHSIPQLSMSLSNAVNSC